MAVARIERSRAEHSGNGLVLLSPGLLARERLEEGDLAEIRTRFGRVSLARVGPAAPPAEDGEVACLDQYLRQGLKARLSDLVVVRRAPEQLSAIRTLVLSPLLDVSRIEGVAEYLRQAFGSQQLPTTVDTVLYAAFPGAALGWSGVTGAPFQVVELEPGPGIITEETEVQLKYTTNVGPGSATDVTFEDVGGLDAQIRQARELMEVPLRFPNVFRRLGINAPRGIIFHGPPGSGKTHLARAIAHEIEAKLFFISGPEVISTAYGETEANLRRIFQEAGSHFPSIIFVDELDVVAPRRGESGSAADTRMSTQFLTLMDGIRRTEGIMIIGTTNRIDAVDMAFRRPGRFDREIYIGAPDAAGRLELLHIHTRGMPLSDEAQDFLPELARVSVGFVGADFLELCREAGLNALRRHLPRESHTDLRSVDVALDELVVEKQDLAEALAAVRPSALRETVVMASDTTWDDVAGLDDAKERLREVVEQPLLHPEVFASMQITPPRGVLLYGPPGTGKSLLARAVARQCNANFVPVRGSEFFSKFLGESEERLRRTFGVARQVAPCIIFLDQLDALAPARTEEIGPTGVLQRVVNQLQAEMDGIRPLQGIMVIAATNRIDLVDRAVLTPDRFGVHIYVPLPNEDERCRTVEIQLRHVPIDPSTTVEQIAAQLAARTEGYSGAELAALCEEAKTVAIRSVDYAHVVPLTLDHFLTGLAKVAYGRSGGRALVESDARAGD